MKKNYRPAAAPLVSQTSRRLMLASPSPIDNRHPPRAHLGRSKLSLRGMTAGRLSLIKKQRVLKVVSVGPIR